MLPATPAFPYVILVDDPDQTEMYALQLERSGFGVIATRHADAAIGEAYARQPVAIVIDVRLPGLVGLNTLRRLKADPTTSSIPVILLTAAVFELNQADAKAAGAAALLWKPCYPADLVDTIRQVIGAASPQPT